MVNPREGREKVRHGVSCPCCDLNRAGRTEIWEGEGRVPARKSV